MLLAVDQTIRLHPHDDVVIARLEIAGGTVLTKENVRAAGPIPAGHKIAVRAVAQGEAGAALRPDHRLRHARHRRRRARAHAQPARWATSQRDYAFCARRRPRSTSASPRTFQGIVRADGRVATRNYIGILTSGELLGDGRAR